MIKRIDDGYIINIDKPKNWTSFDVVRKVRNYTGIRKVGHAGTLDPFATGVLIICVNKATKLVYKFMELPKEYKTILRLGESTDTLDPTGTLIKKHSIPQLNKEKIIRSLESFRGEIKQQIPEFSASKICGKRAYKLARRGISIPRRSKIVHIYEIELLNFTRTSIEFRVVCSKGTYVRMLGYDIAKKLGTVGYLTQLRRTRIGDYSENTALTIPQFEGLWQTEVGNEDISKN
jgi:tRNA pseudouridine55 synthase